MPKNTLVGCVVVTWNNASLSATAIRSLLASDHPNFFVTVVDNGSTDETVAMIRRDFPSVEVVENGENLGFAAANNIGVKAALKRDARQVFLLNNDAIVSTDCLTNISRAADSRRDCGVFGCQVTDPLSAGNSRPSATLHERIGEKKNRQQYAQSQLVDVVWGCGMLITRECLERVKGFDESFFAYDEDRDLCIRARQAGFGVFYSHEAVVQHTPSQSTGGLASDSPFRAYLLGRNRVRLWRKHARRGVFLWGRVALFATKQIASRYFRPNPLAANAALRGIWEGLTVRLDAWPEFPPESRPARESSPL